MSFKGNLSAVPVAELLEWAHASAKTGALELESERFRKVAFFAEGAIVAVDSTEPADCIANRLHAIGFLSEPQAKAALRVSERTGRTVADVLRHTGAVDPNGLEHVVMQHTREALLSTFLWRDGRFLFREGVVPEHVPTVPGIDTKPLAEHGLLRRSHADAIRAKLDGGAARYCLAVDPLSVAQATPLEEQLVKLLARPQSVLSLMVELKVPEFAVLEALEALDAQQALARESDELEPLLTVAADAGSPAVLAAGAVGGDGQEQAIQAIGLLEAPDGRRCALELLSQARIEMQRQNFGPALALFRKAELSEPGDSRISALRAGAEAVYCESIYRGELEPGARPVKVGAIASVKGLYNAELAARLFERMDGRRTVRELARDGSGPESDALQVMLGMVEAGVVQLARG